jgi:predicted Fe-Mo cluster-binding NifX family protein
MKVNSDFWPGLIKKERNMKLCVSSTGEVKNSRVDTSFGRAPFFLIIDMESKEMEVIENTAASAGHGAGIAAAQIVSDAGIDAVLSGYVGPNAFEALQASGIRIFEGVAGSDTVEEVIDRFGKGEYHEKTASTTEPECGRSLGRGREEGGGWRRCRRQ